MTFNEFIRSPAIEGRFRIAKSDDDKHLAFGWASVSVNEDGGQLIDLSGDMIDPDELESAAYNFVRLYRDGGEMHERAGVATLVESIVFTPEKLTALGLPPESLPTGWWLGFFVTDEDVWDKVKNGEYSMFSIEGTANREPVTTEDETASDAQS